MKKSLFRVLSMTLAFIFVLALPVHASDVASTQTRIAVNTGASDVLDINSFPQVRGDGYVKIELPVEAFSQVASPRLQSPLFANVGTLSAFIQRGARSGRSQQLWIDAQIDSIPTWARISNVTVSYQVGTDPWSGVSRHTVVVNRTFNGQWQTPVHFSPNYPQSAPSQSISRDSFNNVDPWGVWSIEFYAVRDIFNPATDNGVTASLRSLSLRIDYR
ncbi:MAG: hypothetical protein FWF80_03940 [Defluviitaleaceae bacterium]|nr:hypothetical protein [Defluviitaleaceae bacterium]